MASLRKVPIIIPVALFILFAIAVVISIVKIGDPSTATGKIPITQHIDASMHDFLIRWRNRIAEQLISRDVVLIGIDDYTTEKLGLYGRGQWITRKPFLEAIKYLREIYQPKVVAYDILFKDIKGTAQDDIPLLSEDYREISDAILKSENESASISDLTLTKMAQLTSNRSTLNLAMAFSGVMENGTSILGTHFLEDRTGRQWNIEEVLGDDPDDLDEDNGTLIPYLKDIGFPAKHIKNIPEDYPYSRKAEMPSSVLLDFAKLGYINAPRDEGGVVRRISLVSGLHYEWKWPDGHPQAGIREQRQIFVPSLALLSCLYYWGIDLVEMNINEKYENNGKPIVEIDFGNAITVNIPDGKTVQIPIDDYGIFYADFVGRIKDFNTVPFANIGPYTADSRARTLLNGQLAFVGLTTTGVGDIGPCPVADNAPLVLVHMVTASNLLTQTFIRPLSIREQLYLLFFIFLILAPLGTFFRPTRFSYICIIIGVIYACCVGYYVHTHKYVLPVTAPLLLIIASFFVVVIYYYFSEAREKKKIRGMFSTMVSGDVLSFLEENPESFSLAGRYAEATMFFSDVAGFTTISEALTPEKLVELLNAYLSPMTEIVMDSGGYVDKYEGDAIMAEWGVPYPNPDHAKLACWAALDQQARIEELRPSFREEFGVDVTVRMGLNSGTVSAGNMGSGKRFSYTVMGDAVNQAARFEPANKDYETKIMIGESTYLLAKDHIDARLLDKIVVKGKTVPIKIYELVARKGEGNADKMRVLELYNNGLEMHWKRDWDNAIAAFDEALKIISDDGPSLAMRTRVEAYKLNPPSESWQGEYVRASKD